jgi:hypothetical protein
MNTPDRGSHEHELDQLLRAYRAACPDPEPSVNFMPELWQRIESRQTFSYFLERMAGKFVTAAVALTLAMAAYLYVPQSNGVFYSQTYVEALMAGQTDNADLFDAVLIDDSEMAGQL